MFLKKLVVVYVEKNLNFCLYEYVRSALGGGGKALADISAKNVRFFLDGSP